MRTLLLVSVLAACSSSRTERPVERGAFRFEDVVETADDVTHVRVHHQDVPLEQLPLAPFLAGLPMAGNANIEIALRVPLTDGVPDARGVTGVFSIQCPKGCSIGDGVAALRAPREELLPFGKITFDELDIRGVAQDGKVSIIKWHAVSKDVVLDLALNIELASAFESSLLSGCVSFKAQPSLAQRDPKTATLIATTGAVADDTGLFSIAIEGTVGAKKMLAKRCGQQVAAGEVR